MGGPHIGTCTWHSTCTKFKAAGHTEIWAAPLAYVAKKINIHRGKLVKNMVCLSYKAAPKHRGLTAKTSPAPAPPAATSAVAATNATATNATLAFRTTLLGETRGASGSMTSVSGGRVTTCCVHKELQAEKTADKKLFQDQLELW